METCIDKTLKEFRIEFSGLSIGEHHFSYVIDDIFFEKFEYSDITKASVNIDIVMQREERLLIFDFSINGYINTVCDSCGDDFNLSINGNNNLIIKFGREFEEPEENIIILPENEYKIDLHHHIYEYICLLIPIKKTHANDGINDCNSDTLNRLVSINNNENKDNTNPQWDVLAKYKNKFDN